MEMEGGYNRGLILSGEFAVSPILHQFLDQFQFHRPVPNAEHGLKHPWADRRIQVRYAG